MSQAQAQQPGKLTVDGITINVYSMQDAVTSIIAAAQRGENFSVCTLNLDHVVQLQRSPDFHAAYRRARFVTADGFPIAMLGRLAGARVQRTTGADLVLPICEQAAAHRIPIFMFGANTLTLHRAARRLTKRFKGLEVAGCFAPGYGFDSYSSEADAAIEMIKKSGAKLCFVALGAPRQEIFAARCIDELNGTGLLCVGAALDFIAGTQHRAPSITQKIGMEWAWRLLRNPQRLGLRYARCIAVIPRLVVRTLPQIVSARIRNAA